METRAEGHEPSEANSQSASSPADSTAHMRSWIAPANAGSGVAIMGMRRCCLLLQWGTTYEPDVSGVAAVRIPMAGRDPIGVQVEAHQPRRLGTWVTELGTPRRPTDITECEDNGARHWPHGA